MSQQAKPGRRTPLSLGTPKADSNDKMNMRTGKATVNLEKLTADQLIKQTKNGSSSDEKIDNNKSENGQSNAQNNGSTTKKDTGNGVPKDPTIDLSKIFETPEQGTDGSKTPETPKQGIDHSETPKQGNDKTKNLNDKSTPKSAEKPIEKSKSSNEKSTTINDKPKVSSDKAENVLQGVSGITKLEEPKNNGEKEVRESIRQKQIREEKEKEENGKATSDKDENASQGVSGITKLEEAKNNGEKEVRGSVRQKQIREEKEKEENGKVAPSTPEENSESPKVKDKRKTEVTPTKTPKTAPSDSLLAEKSLKGFNENLEEADSMRINDSPMPATDSKILKFVQGPPTRGTRRSDKLDDASLVVNLSTVSEQSNESVSNNTPATERPSYSLKHISGRRSTRPLREVSFDFRMRESYAKIQNDFNDSDISTNDTYGSESPRDNFRSSLYTGVGTNFKRSVDEDVIESPKRSKFDFGLFDLVSSPVTKLRERFARTIVSTSTPNKLIVTEVADKKEDIPSGIEAENFVADEITPITELSPVEDEMKSNIEMDIDAVNEEAPIEIREPRKSRCAVM